MAETLRIENDVAWVGHRRVPASASLTVFDHSSVAPDGRHLDTHRRGFTLPFENGWTLSVFWGSRRIGRGRAPAFDEVTDKAREVRVTDRDGRVVVWDDDDRPLGKSLDHPGVRYAVPATKVLELIDEVATWPTHHLPVLDRG